MSLSTALSLETLTPDALFAASERDLCELWTYYDSNGNGLIEFEVRHSQWALLLKTTLRQGRSSRRHRSSGAVSSTASDSNRPCYLRCCMPVVVVFFA